MTADPDNSATAEPQKLRICQVIGGATDGGLQRHFVDLSNQLSARHDVIAIGHPRYRDRLANTVHYEELDLERSRHNPKALFDLYRVLRRHNPQIIHAHANKATSMVARVAGFLNARCVATIHGRKRQLRAYRKFDLVIAVSQELAATIPNDNTVVIHNGMAPIELPENVGPDYLREEFGIDADRPILVAVGRLVQVKGYDVLIRSLKQTRARLIIVGDGEEQKSLEALAKQLNVEDRVHLVGFRTDAPAIMASADMMVISSHREGFPYVLTEALHVRQLIVSTQVPGVGEFLPESFIVPVNNPEALAAVINRVLDDREAATRDFEPVWQRAANELTLEAMATKTEALYRGLLGAGRGAADRLQEGFDIEAKA